MTGTAAGDRASGARPEGTRSVSGRFTLALIGVVTVLLVGFAAIVIVVNVREIDAGLREQLDDAARLAQVSLAVPLWNLDTETLDSFAQALLLRDSLVFVEILSENQSAAVRRRPGVPGESFSDFTKSSAYLARTADIVHEGKKIGRVRLAVSRAGLRNAILWNVAGILALTLASIAAISLTSVVITRRYVARPLAALQRSAGLIAGGNLEVAIDTSDRDEIGRLARDLDGMRGSIKTLLEERRRYEEGLEEANRTLEQRVEERTSALQQKTRELTRTVEELRALGEVGRAVSSTLDLETVLTVIVSRAVQLTGTDGGAIYEYEAPTETFQLRATCQMEPELIEALRAHPIRLGEGTVGRAAVTRRPVQIPDIQEDGSYDERLRDLFRDHGFRARLAVPLVREDQIVGALVVRRKAAGSFSPELTDLLQTFATQSVLAIQNARLFREIEDQRRQLELASQHKSQFLANMSHELRTPMNAVLGYTDLILDDIFGEVPAPIRETLERVKSNGQHLLGLINDVLDLSKMEAGQLSLVLGDYSMREVVHAVVSAVESLATGKNLALKAFVPADLPQGRGDERRLTQVLLNLTGNAIKFTDAGSVSIAARAADGAFVVSVTDTGPGISPADQRKIFEEFQQADSTSTRKKGGSGLGLTISRRIVELHGGRLWVESVPGEGSTFFFTVPLRMERPAEPA
jgi:signal transduction histidine kinase/HAMP domain-containing protein